MIDQTAPQVVRNYLAQLESALGGLPTDVRDGIVAGVAEELSGLDAATAAERIEPSATRRSLRPKPARRAQGP